MFLGYLNNWTDGASLWEENPLLVSGTSTDRLAASGKPTDDVPRLKSVDLFSVEIPMKSSVDFPVERSFSGNHTVYQWLFEVGLTC